jgi:hypothetical protein
MQIFKKITLAMTLPLMLMFMSTPAFARIDPGPNPNPGPNAQVAADSSTKTAIQCGVNSASSGDCTKQPTSDLNTTILNIVNLLTALVGVLAVIMIIVGGLRYVTSAGNPEGAKSARSTILYAVIGLVVVALSQVIARFVLKHVT